jgi:hypothetical protein
VLGIDSTADLTDDDVRSAWRRIATATHPDRADGGDSERFAIAAAAYTTLRTHSGRGEARAALRSSDHASAVGRHSGGPALTGRSWSGRLASRLRHGRPVRLALRTLAAAVMVTVAVLAAGPRPAAPALAVGIVTWLLITARHDLGQ